jgi:hypothetical protein
MVRKKDEAESKSDCGGGIIVSASLLNIMWDDSVYIAII